ncbi:hypothetical protein [Schumannella sp. 10F1B-5-1]|uniref:hypothetical protein n=1 Tax=Schumannella sp. 10F1B-5-1 TaxID=2590780 RepID=UPI0011309EE1|nr:hypothetical protein [Schumannella sp. 10F1B-5-1]TPW70069.1 hypothetical protein FJ658_13625 [Schumannella sp. 10F1B-5-1]
MGFLDRLFGSEDTATDSAPRRTDTAPRPQHDARSQDEIAIERYRYLLRTAPPETIEQVHREAFAKLTDEQRAMIYEELSRGAGTGERPLSSEPATLARAATRAEFRQPGSMERVMSGSAFGASSAANAGGQGQYGSPGYGQHPESQRYVGQNAQQQRGPGMGAMIGSSLLGTVAGYVIGSALVSAFLPWDGGAGDTASDSGDSGSGDSGSSDASGGDAGVDTASADSGGDFGGGDFGGGDFGGDFGDFGF